MGNQSVPDIRPDYQSPNYDPEKIAPYTLEDPLTFIDGSKVRNSEDWQKRRKEILEIFASEMFGDKSFIKVVGIFTAANTAGLALGMPFANMCFDVFGGYSVAFIILAVFMLFAIVFMNLSVNAASRDKRIILESEENIREALEV